MEKYLVFVVLLFFISCENANEKYVLLKNGNEFLAKNDLKKARKNYEWAISEDSCFVDALCNLGLVAVEEKNFEEAAVLLDRALTCVPDFYNGLVNKLNLKVQLNELEAAKAIASTLIENNPDSMDVYFDKLVVLSKMHLYDEALQLCNQIDAKFDSIPGVSTDVMINKANLMFLNSEFDLAIEMFDQVDSGAHYSKVLNGKALAYIEKGNLDAALVLIDVALQLEPNNALFSNNKGLVMLEMGQLDEGLTWINKSLIEAPENSWVYAYKGNYYLKTGAYPQALEMLNQAESMGAGLPKLYYWLAMVHFYLDHPTQACDYVNKSADKTIYPPALLEGCL